MMVRENLAAVTRESLYGMELVLTGGECGVEWAGIFPQLIVPLSECPAGSVSSVERSSSQEVPPIIFDIRQALSELRIPMPVVEDKEFASLLGKFVPLKKLSHCRSHEELRLLLKKLDTYGTQKPPIKFDDAYLGSVISAAHFCGGSSLQCGADDLYT
jgi:hypothetical protein